MKCKLSFLSNFRMNLIVQTLAVEAIRNRISLSYGIVANGNTKQNILSLLDFTNMRIGLKGIYESVENALLEFNTP
jgi:hypothetical protein